MYRLVAVKSYRKQVARLLRSTKHDFNKLNHVIDALRVGEALPERYQDHPLKGRFYGCRECHIQPDWLLIYRLDLTTGTLELLATGSHSELF